MSISVSKKLLKLAGVIIIIGAGATLLMALASFILSDSEAVRRIAVKSGFDISTWTLLIGGLMGMLEGMVYLKAVTDHRYARVAPVFAAVSMVTSVGDQLFEMSKKGFAQGFGKTVISAVLGVLLVCAALKNLRGEKASAAA